jgi:Flp pilus assembly protein TadD
MAPDDKDAHARLLQVLKDSGDRAVANGRIPFATETYRELIALEPGDPELHNNFGILLARSGDYRGAEEQFQMALKLNPALDAARRNLEIARKKAHN